MATYYALTTTNPRYWWIVLAVEASRDEAEKRGLEELDRRNPGGLMSSISAETERRNFRVMSRSAAERGRFVPRLDDARYWYRDPHEDLRDGEQ